ncbi:SDR family oxidoreductase [Pseudonocardia spinosispora]|uniref:SDR family oxidoreductase n=1 Tax=Pseudonocardia spinosispora TaxID=103441 RepID=UPI0003FCB979|nr:SDR family oxidoreductase [Pseudonocardia spinosispora]
MRVFVTGGTGLIGSAVVAELLTHGHTVLALTRSDASARTLDTAGADTVRGSLSDLDVLRQGARETDGVIHLAFSHDFSTVETIERATREEVAALATLGDVLLGTNKPIVVASGTPHTGGRPSTEADPTPVIAGPLAGRGQAVNDLFALTTRGVRASAVRLPRTVHNEGQGGFAGQLTDIARRTGVAAYPGDGAQRWPAGHALDAAVLFRLALESAPAGTAWHAVDDEGDAVRDIVAVIGRRLNLPVESRPEAHFGPLGPVFALDQPSSSTHTREALGWTPTHPRLLADLENLQP